MRSQNIVMLLLAALAGAGAGVVTSSYARVTLDDYTARLLDERRFSALLPSRAAVDDNAADGVRAVREDGFRSVAVFYPAVSPAATADRWQVKSAATGVGVVVSGDGWVLTTADVADAVTGKEAVVQGRRYAVARVVKDTRSAFALVRLEGASGLPTVAFGGSLLMGEGDGVLLGDSVRGITASTLSRIDMVRLADKVVHQAEVYDRHWQLDREVTSTVMWNAAGEMVGLIGKDGQPLPLHEGGGFVGEVIRTGKSAHAALGVYVVDITRVVNVDQSLTRGRLRGELVTAPVGKSALAADGPAAKAGIVAGDLIVAVDTVPVGAARSLAAILGDYDPGEIANLTVIRGNETMTIPVTLGDAEKLVY